MSDVQSAAGDAAAPDGTAAGSANERQPDPGQEQSSGGGAEPKSERAPWLDQVKPEYHENPLLKDIDGGVNGLVERYIEVAGKGDPVYFKSDMSEDQLKSYREAAGIPESADAYGETTLPADAYIKAGINVEQAKLLESAQKETQKEAAKAEKQRIASEAKQVLKELQEESGDNREGFQVNLKKGMKAIPKEIAEYIASDPIGNNKTLLKFIAEYGKSQNEHRMIDNVFEQGRENGEAYDFSV